MIEPPPALTVHTRQDRSILSCCLRQILTLPILSGSGVAPVCSSAAAVAVVHSERLFCRPRIVTSGNLCYCCLLSAWTSLVILLWQGFFAYRTATHWIFFFFFLWIYSFVSDYSLQTMKMVVRENHSRSEASKIFRPASLALTTMPRSKVTWISFLPHSDAQFLNFRRWSSACLNALSCCHVIGWLDIQVNEQLNGCIINWLWLVSLYIFVNKKYNMYLLFLNKHNFQIIQKKYCDKNS